MWSMAAGMMLAISISMERITYCAGPVVSDEYDRVLMTGLGVVVEVRIVVSDI